MLVQRKKALRLFNGLSGGYLTTVDVKLEKQNATDQKSREQDSALAIAQLTVKADKPRQAVQAKSSEEMMRDNANNAANRHDLIAAPIVDDLDRLKPTTRVVKKIKRAANKANAIQAAGPQPRTTRTGNIIYPPSDLERGRIKSAKIDKLADAVLDQEPVNDGHLISRGDEGETTRRVTVTPNIEDIAEARTKSGLANDPYKPADEGKRRRVSPEGSHESTILRPGAKAEFTFRVEGLAASKHKLLKVDLDAQSIRELAAFHFEPLLGTHPLLYQCEVCGTCVVGDDALAQQRHIRLAHGVQSLSTHIRRYGNRVEQHKKEIMAENAAEKRRSRAVQKAANALKNVAVTDREREMLWGK